MAWGISKDAPIKEKIKADINDFMMGLNLCGSISYNTYSELYDEFEKALNKMSELGISECDDVSYVIYDKKRKLYYCGMKSWNKSVRKAQFFHSKKYLMDRIDEFKKAKISNRCTQLKADLFDLEDLVVRKVFLTISDTFDIEEFEKMEV